MEITKEGRKEKIAELRKHHEKTFETLGIKDAYYCCKVAHYAKSGDTSKVVGLYPSECQKGDSVYVEFCTHEYIPVDHDRRLYVWEHNADLLGTYEMKKMQYLVPVSDLKPVGTLECKLPVEGKVFDTTAIQTWANNVRPRPDVKRPFEEGKEINTYIRERHFHKQGYEHVIIYTNDKPTSYTVAREGEAIAEVAIRSEILEDVIQFMKNLI